MKRSWRELLTVAQPVNVSLEEREAMARVLTLITGHLVRPTSHIAFEAGRGLYVIRGQPKHRPSAADQS